MGDKCLKSEFKINNLIINNITRRFSTKRTSIIEKANLQYIVKWQDITSMVFSLSTYYSWKTILWNLAMNNEFAKKLKI